VLLAMILMVVVPIVVAVVVGVMRMVVHTLPTKAEACFSRLLNTAAFDEQLSH
jgi:hypothetical protein